MELTGCCMRAALLVLLLGTCNSWRAEAVTGKSIDRPLGSRSRCGYMKVQALLPAVGVDEVAPGEPSDWDMDVRVDNTAQLRDAICAAQGGIADLANPSQCMQIGSTSPRTRIELVGHLGLGGQPLPPLRGWVKIIGRCGSNLNERCDIHAVGPKCSLCQTPSEGASISGSTCDDCKQGTDFTDTRPIRLLQGAKVWLDNISVRGCRTRSSGGCILLSGGDPGVWSATDSIGRQPLTYLKAESVVVARGYAQGEGGGLAIGRGALAVLDRCTLENNYAASAAGPNGEGSHDALVQNYAALVLHDPDPAFVKVAVTTVLDTPGNFNGDYVEGFLDVTFSSAIVTTRPPVLDTPTPTATTEGEQAVEPPGASLPPPIVIIEKRPLWIDLVIAGGVLLVVFLLAVCFFFCFMRTGNKTNEQQEDDSDTDADSQRVYNQATSVTNVHHSRPGDEDAKEVVESMPVIVQSPKPEDVDFPDWTVSQEERVTEHLRHMHMHMHTQHVQGRVPHRKLEPLAATSTADYGRGHPLRQNDDFRPGRTITSAERGKRGKHQHSNSPDRPGSASPALRDIAVNPLRPPSALGAPVAVWQPSAVSSSQRPSTAPIKSAADRRDHATGSWSTAKSSFGWPIWGKRKESAAVTRGNRGHLRHSDSQVPSTQDGDGPKPAWRYLVEQPKNPTELPDPAGPRPHHWRNASDEAPEVAPGK